MISWLITSKAWSTGILVKRADTSKETNSSLSCRLMDCSLSVRSLESLTKDIIYQWSCTNPDCKSSYIGETSRSLCERAKEHSKEGSNSAIYHHCSSKGHPQPNVDQFKVIDQEKSQIAREAKEAIHIRKFDPELNRNIGKMVIPRVFDSLLGIKPKNPRIASLLSQETGSQDIGIGLTQFHSRIDKRVNPCSNRAQRARNFFSN